MRPPEFTGGNIEEAEQVHARSYASMRPPEFTGGNLRDDWEDDMKRVLASMRPPEFTGGNVLTGTIDLAFLIPLQ